MSPLQASKLLMTISFIFRTSFPTNWAPRNIFEQTYEGKNKREKREPVKEVANNVNSNEYETFK